MMTVYFTKTVPIPRGLEYNTLDPGILSACGKKTIPASPEKPYITRNQRQS
jgi:hypothetical protein